MHLPNREDRLSGYLTMTYYDGFPLRMDSVPKQV